LLVQVLFPRKFRLIPLLILLTILAGCNTPSVLQAPIAAQPAPGLIPTLLPSVTSVPTLTATATASATATPLPSATPLPTATPVPPPLEQELAAELQAILDRIVADGFIPGATLTVSIPGYAPWSGASGYADRSQTQPVTPETRMRMASISKIFTAVVVLQLVEEGRIDLEAPLSAWYPDLVPRAEAMTVRQLLSHTTGLYDYLEDSAILARAYRAPDYWWQPSELATYAGQRRALFAPGAPGAWDYSSTNYVILGMIVEAVTGNSLAHEIRTRIFTPLKLEATYFVPDDSVAGPYARGYRNAQDVSDISLSFAYATANIVAISSDIQRFGDALFSGELLQPATLAQMLTFLNGKGQYNMPALEYGLGVMRNTLPLGPDAQGRRRSAELSTVIGHTGGFGGFRSVLWHAPESGVTIALGENQGATDPNILATRVLEAVLRAQGR
jgi:CubicO group peptidase (beta-lactamase class C family)